MSGESKPTGKGINVYWPIVVLACIATVLWILEFYVFMVDYYDAHVNTGSGYWDTDVRYNAFSDFYYWFGIIWPGITVACFLLCIKLFSVHTMAGKTWLLLTISMILWFIGDFNYTIAWTWFNHLEDLPTINPGRICYISGYALMLVGIALQGRAAGTKLEGREKTILVVIVSLAITLSTIFVAIPIALTELSDPVEKGILIYYLVFDEVNIAFTIVLIFKYRGGQFARAWLIIAVGFILVAVYDIIYEYTTYVLVSETSFYFVEPIFYHGMYLTLAIGAAYLFISVRTLRV
ncbi:MAG: hypothetical protein Q6373_001165 [Candidatus Sigynarchaeota archaeon]